MPRITFVVLSTCLLAACGEDEVSTASLSGDQSSGGASSSTGTTADVPTTSGDTTASTSGVSNSGDESSTGSSSETATTSPVEPATTTTSGTTTSDDTTSTAADDTTSSSTTSSSTTSSSTTADDTTSTTADDTTTGEPNLCGAPDFPDLGVAPQFATCQATASESRWCLALGNGNAVTALGLDSQTACPVVQLQTPDIEIFAVGSLGVVGGDLFTCTSQFDGVAARVSLQTGAVELAALPCSAISVWRGHIILQTSFPNGEFRVFTDWTALTQNQSIWQFNAPGTFNESFTTQGDTLYTAWHSDNSVARFELPCGDPLGEVMFDGFDDWMQGVAVTADDRFHTYGFSYNGVRSFDADAGVGVQDWPQVPIDGVALACFLQAD